MYFLIFVCIVLVVMVICWLYDIKRKDNFKFITDLDLTNIKRNKEIRRTRELICMRDKWLKIYLKGGGKGAKDSSCKKC